MMNIRIVLSALGLLLLIEGFFLLLSAGVAKIYGGTDFMPLLLSAGIAATTGFLLFFFNRKAPRQIGKREGYIIVSMAWVVFSLFGMLPFLISGAIPDITNAFFETISGFTTTGATILNDIEALPHGLLFWRSLTQWLGGMGIIVLSLAILPLLGIGGMSLFVAEVPGITPDKIHPRVRQTAKQLWGIYVIFTAAEAVLLYLAGMNVFDAVNHAFTTMATGGYSTKQASIAAFSPSIQYIITLFMFLAGTNFAVSYFALKGRFSAAWRNEEFRFYLGFAIFFTLLITLGLSLNDIEHLEFSFRRAIFQVVSLMTTTGYVTDNYLAWGTGLSTLAFVVMFFGGSTGSTGGGIKIARIVVLMKNSYLEFKRLLHANAVIPVRLNKRAVQPFIINKVLAFIGFYLLIFGIGTAFMSAMNMELESAMGATIAALGNVGPGIGSVGPMDNFYHITDVGKWGLSFLMLVGRLELFTVLILFSPAFWANR